MKIKNEPRDHYSVSQLTTYLRCPLSYYYQYDLGISWKTTPSAVAFGKTMHDAIAQVNRSLMDIPMSQDDAEDVFTQLWSHTVATDDSIGWKRTDEAGKLLTKGVGLIRLYVEEYKDARPVAVELPWRLPILDPASGLFIESRDAVGIIDALFQSAEGGHNLVEVKTSSRSLSCGDAENNLQLTLYSYAHNMLYGEKESDISLVVLVKTQEPKLQLLHTKRCAADYTRLISLMEKVIMCIDKGIYYPNPEPRICCTCSYKEECKDWPK